MPDDAYKATLVKNAMQAIEDNNEQMDGVLPKEVYGQLVPEEEPELLSKIIRVFKDIPEDISIDLFGEIYKYFLGNFIFIMVIKGVSAEKAVVAMWLTASIEELS